MIDEGLSKEKITSEVTETLMKNRKVTPITDIKLNHNNTQVYVSTQNATFVWDISTKQLQEHYDGRNCEPLG